MAMGAPARFVGALLCASQKPISEAPLRLIPFGFSRRLKTLVDFRSVFLSETAGAGNGLIEKACIDG
jgi:hypothetical protein